MRVWTAIVLFLLGACRQEPDFDTRYDAAEAKIRTQASEIEAELAANRKLRERTEAGAGADIDAARDASPDR